MSKKVILNIALFFLIIIDIVLILNLKWYLKILNYIFNDCIDVNLILYVFICLIIAFISILIFIAMKLVVQNKKDEIKGIKLKIEDGTFGTANWMSNEEIENVLGVIGYEEYRT